MGDYYELLGVQRDASQDEIKRAFRKKAMELHPDANPDDPESEAAFKEVALAYEILSDPERRQRYDRYGPEGVAAGADAFNFNSNFGSLGDIFDAFFGGGATGFGGSGGRAGPPRGQDLEVVAEIDFEKAVFGGEHAITIRTALAATPVRRPVPRRDRRPRRARSAVDRDRCGAFGNRSSDRW